MNFKCLWVALVLVALGVFGILDGTGALELTGAVEKWWPIAIVGFGPIAMVADRRISLGPAIITAVGLGLLADAQEWPSEYLVWDSLLVALGLVILFRSRERAGDDATRGETRHDDVTGRVA